MRGSLTPDTLARVLQGLAVSRKEGILHLQRDAVEKRIYVKQGFIIFADSDDERERLGEVLVRAGKLKRSDLELALRVMKETGQRLGKTIVEMGFTSSADIAALARDRTGSIMRSVFSWPSGTFRFEERDPDVDDEVALELSTTEMILEAARGIEDLELIRRGLGDLNAVLRQPANPLLPYEGSVSSSVEWLLYQANGVSTMEEIAAVSPLDEGKTLRSIYALVLAGIVEIEAPDKVTAARTEGTKVSLGMKPGASPPTGPSTLAPTVPKTLGRYEVERLLGRGAMGAVYLARDPTIDRTVAIKLIQTAVHLTPSELEKYQERFYREAKAAGKLLHPGIVTVFDVGHTDDATPFIVMEYVGGRTLQEILKTEKLEQDEVLRLSVKILEPLAYAHSNGIVHRDIKPANILVTPDGEVKVMDFGIAHVVGSDLTQADDVLGSPNYMAPEQLSKEAIDARTDLFAFGVLLYRMLTGTLPFRGDSFAAIAKAVLFEEPAPPSSLESSIPEHLSGVVLRCLAKEPARRFETANELKRALGSRAGGHEVPDTGRVVPSHASNSRDPTLSRKQPQPATKAGGSLPDLWRGSMLRDLAGVAVDRLRRADNRIVLGAAGALGAALLVAFALSRGPSATEGVSQHQTTPTPGFNATPGDAELYREATVAFERGDLDASKEALETLMGGSPGFEGAAELLVRVNQELRNAERSGAREQASAPEPAPATPPAEARLLYQATLAFERGDLEASKRQLEALLRANPSLEGASELLVRVNDEIWKKSLPLSFRARHNHRFGGCSGTLTLAAWGLRYRSEEHEWRWEFDDIRVMEMDRSSVLNLQTREREDPSARVGRVLGLGTAENYKFELRDPMRDEDWSRYLRVAR